jgi:copper chaperone CopZ
LRYGFGQLPQDIARALVLGVIISGLITVLIPAESLPEMATTGLSAMVLMMLVGMPLYICSTASIPVAFAFMNMGVSPGAALVFLVTGPATNAAAMTTMWRVLGRRAWFVYLATIVVCAFLAGILLDALSGTAGLQEAAVAVGPDCHLSWFQQAAAVVLVIILLPGLVPQRWRRRKDSACCAVSDRDSCAQTPSGPGAAAQAIEGFEFLVSGMRCSHCVATVTRVLSATPGVRGVDVDLESGRVRVVGPAPDASRLVAEIEKLGYTVTGTPAPIRESGV